MTKGVQRLTRKNTCDIAKVVRNLEVPDHVKIEVGMGLRDFFDKLDPFFDRQLFMNIVNSSIEGDFRTDWCSDLKKFGLDGSNSEEKKEDDKEV